MQPLIKNEKLSQLSSQFKLKKNFLELPGYLKQMSLLVQFIQSGGNTSWYFVQSQEKPVFPFLLK